MVPLYLLGDRGVISAIRMETSPSVDQTLPHGLRPLSGLVRPPERQRPGRGGSPHLTLPLSISCSMDRAIGHQVPPCVLSDKTLQQWHPVMKDTINGYLQHLWHLSHEQRHYSLKHIFIRAYKYATVYFTVAKWL